MWKCGAPQHFKAQKKLRGCCQSCAMSLLQSFMLDRECHESKTLFVQFLLKNWSNNMVVALTRHLSRSFSRAAHTTKWSDEEKKRAEHEHRRERWRKKLKCNFINLLIRKYSQQTIKKTSFRIIICTCMRSEEKIYCVYQRRGR